MKEAQRSFGKHSPVKLFANQGQRVVIGQRLTRSASDIFHGWTASARATTTCASSAT